MLGMVSIRVWLTRTMASKLARLLSVKSGTILDIASRSSDLVSIYAALFLYGPRFAMGAS